MLYEIDVDRLWGLLSCGGFFDPWAVGPLPDDDGECEQPYRWPDLWSPLQHRQRINYIKGRQQIAPIDVSWDFEFRAVYVQDGNHRLVAAFEMGRKTILCTYDGPVKALEYLQGLTNEIPLSE